MILFSGEPQLTGRATLQVEVLDVNDNAPDFQDKNDVPVVRANPGIDVEVARLAVVDLDSQDGDPRFQVEVECNKPENERFCQDFTYKNSAVGMYAGNTNHS